MKDKKGVTIVNAFLSILENSVELHSNGKSNKIWVGKSSEFYNSSFKKWLQDNNIEIYSLNNEGKFVVAERFITTLKSKFSST